MNNECLKITDSNIPSPESQDKFQDNSSEIIFSQVSNKKSLVSDKKKIEECNFSRRALNILIQQKIKTLGDLKNYSFDEMLRWRNSGRKTLDEIIDVLNANSQENPLWQELKICIFEFQDNYSIYYISFELFSELKKCTTLSDVKNILKNQNPLSISDRNNIDVFIFNRNLCSKDFLVNEKTDINKDVVSEIIVLQMRNVKKDIEECNFSRRALNVLIQQKIKTLDELKKYSLEEMLKWRNAGRKTLHEIIDVLNASPQESISQQVIKICIFEINCIFELHNNYHIYQIPIELYSELKNCVSLYDIDEILKKQKLLSQAEIKDIDVFVFHRSFYNTKFYKVCREAADKYDEILNHQNDNIPYIMTILFSCLNKNPTIDMWSLENLEIIEKIFNNERYLKIAKEQILKTLEKNPFGVSINILKTSFPDSVQKTNIIESALYGLERANLIKKNKNETYELILSSVKDFIANVKDIRIKDFLERKILQGQTLEEISNVYNITRERVRQIINNNFNLLIRHSKFEEDRYADIYKKYKFSKEQSKLIFGELTSNYFSTRYDSGSINLEEILEDKSVPLHIRKQIRIEIIYPNCIYVGKQYVKKTRPDLIRYYIRHFCLKDTDIDSFLNDFASYCKKFGLDKDLYVINDETFTNKVSRMKNVLYKYPRSFRFYEFEKYDFTDLLDTLNLAQFENIMLSTAKFIREYPKLMKKYDIKDEYELHSLLRNLLEEDNKNITFHRMPSIEFGHADIDRQVIELLEENSPISSIELAKLYEEKYGTYFKTAIGSCFNCISNYLHKGVYSISFPNLTSDEANYLQMQLTDDFYTINSVKNIFSKRYTDLSHINPYTLKNLGFIVNDNHIIKNKYQNASLYFKYLLLRNEKFQYSDIIPEIRKNVNFNSILNTLLDNYDILEYSKKQFINYSKIASFGITKSDLLNFCKQVYDLELPDFFTLTQITQIGYSHKLFELGFDDWFCTKILSRNNNLFSSQHIGGVIVLSKDKKSITWVSLLESIIPENGMDIYKLLDYLQEVFSMHVSQTDIIGKIIDSDLYYDKIMEKIYLNYDNYFEEI